MERRIYLDYIKALAIFLVLVYHCHFFDSNVFIAAALSMCCPLFFAVNGGLMLKKERTFAYYAPKILKILALIIIWGVVSNVGTALINDEPYSALQCYIDLTTLKIGYCNHLWFMCTLFCLYCFYPLLSNVVKDKKTMYVALSIICCLSFAWISKLTYFFSPLSGWHGYALAYAIGGFAISGINVKNKWILLAISVGALTAQAGMNYIGLYDTDMIFFGYKTLLVFVATLSLIMFLSKCELKRNSFINFVGSNTLGIYLTHLFFIRIWINGHDFSIAIELLIPIFLLVLCCAICWIMNKSRYTKWFISI